MVKLGQHEGVKNFIVKPKNTSLDEKKDIFNAIKGDTDLLPAFLIKFFEKRARTNEYTAFKRYMIQELTNISETGVLYIHYYENIYPFINETRKKSSDIGIHEGYKEPSFYLRNPNLLQQNKEGSDIWRLLSKENDEKITFIEAQSGTGKTRLISTILQNLAENKFIYASQTFNPVLISLSNISDINDIQKRIREIHNDYKFSPHIKNIYIFEALDESSMKNEQKQQFIDFCSQPLLQGKIIITGRNGSLDRTGGLEKFKDDIDIITLDELPEEYITKIIENNFSGNEQKKTLFYDKIMKNSDLKTLIKNPLNLKVVCGLIYHNKIHNTDTLSEIYEKIVEKRLSWEDEKPSRKPTFKREDSEEEKEEMETFLQQRKEFLSELAYQIVFEGQKIDKEAFAALKKQHMLMLLDNNSLSMLYRKKNTGEYGFVYQFLEKNFAVKQFIKNIESKEEKALEEYFDKIFFLQKANQIDHSDIGLLIYDMVSKQDNAGIRNKLLYYLLNHEQDKMSVQDKTPVIYKQMCFLFEDSLKEMKK